MSTTDELSVICLKQTRLRYSRRVVLCIKACALLHKHVYSLITL